MKILNELIDKIDNADTRIQNICTGAFWTSVTSVYTGLSTTYREFDQQHTDNPCMVPLAGELNNLSVRELAKYALSDNTVAASIGMATINSAIEINDSFCTHQNASEVVAERSENANVAVIGHFPFAKGLKKKAANVWIIERKPPQPGVLPESAAKEVLPKCDVVCMSGTTLINHTFETLMQYCKNAFVVLTGPTSPLSPILFDYGIDVISGSRVTNPQKVNTFITQGATFRQVKKQGVQLYSMMAAKST